MVEENTALKSNSSVINIHEMPANPRSIEKNTYRTRKKAGEIVTMPNKYAIITYDKYKNAIGLHQAGKAYLQPLMETAKLDYKKGTLFLEGLPASEKRLRETYAKNVSEELDLSLLRVFYSVLLDNYQKNSLSQVTTIYLPDLFDFIGKKSVSRNEIEGIIHNMIRFHNVMGIIDGNILPVLLYMGEEREKNTISFSSPYMNKVIEKIHASSLLTDKKGNPRLKKDGLSLTRPVYSYLIKPSIRNEKNKKAIEIVHIVTLLIEQAGNSTPHISARTIIERNPFLKWSLENATPADKNKILKRAFSKAWELLHTQTYLEETYKDIRMPNPVDSQYIPTMSKVDMVFEFPHHGKKK